jgi:hypothetical protein
MKNKTESEQFCHSLLGLLPNRSRALTNLVMALSSDCTARSAVELSESPFCHYTYSNFSKILADIAHNEPSFAELVKSIRRLLQPYIPGPRSADGVFFYGFSTDVTTLIKAHSPCLEGRQYVPTSNNLIASNRSIGIGYRASMMHLNVGESHWCPPLSIELLNVESNALEVAIIQIRSLLTDPDLPFKDHLCLEKNDSAYGRATFLAYLYDLNNLVCISRLRSGTRVWQQEQHKETGGAPQIYGKKWYLNDVSINKSYSRKVKGVKKDYTVWQESIMDLPCTQYCEFNTTLNNGRLAIIKMHRWNDLLMRSKGLGKNATMKDKPYDLVRVEVLDAKTQKRIFGKPLYIALNGKRKSEVSTHLAQKQYRERFDVEGLYRFGKQKMLLDKYQTPDRQHLQNWLIVWQLANWLLLTAQKDCINIVKPWEKYLPVNKLCADNISKTLTLAQTRKSVSTLFATFDKTPFLPQKCKKGKGRKKGDKQTPRTCFNIEKKKPKPTKNQKKDLLLLKKQLNE